MERDAARKLDVAVPAAPVTFMPAAVVAGSSVLLVAAAAATVTSYNTPFGDLAEKVAARAAVPVAGKCAVAVVSKAAASAAVAMP